MNTSYFWMCIKQYYEKKNSGRIKMDALPREPVNIIYTSATGASHYSNLYGSIYLLSVSDYCLLYMSYLTII